MSLIEELVFWISRHRHMDRPATFDASKYAQWRDDSLRSQYEANFSWGTINGARVLDFGCGAGALSLMCAEHGARSVVGIDLDPKRIESARANSRSDVRFLVGETDRVRLPDSSVDVILCFDVLEHIMDPEAILHEWARVLVPGGSVLIWWVPWWHPYGHHLQTMIPLPWVHAVLPDAALMRVCARIYDTPEFQPRIWHFDEQGQRKPNPYHGPAGFDNTNSLTVKEFEQITASAGLRVARKKVCPFSGRFGALKAVLSRISADCFSSFVVYELEAAPAEGRNNRLTESGMAASMIR